MLTLLTLNTLVDSIKPCTIATGTWAPPGKESKEQTCPVYEDEAHPLDDEHGGLLGVAHGGRQPLLKLLAPIDEHVGGHEQERALVRVVGMKGVQEGDALDRLAQAHGVRQDAALQVILLKVLVRLQSHNFSGSGFGGPGTKVILNPEVQCARIQP